MVVRSEDDGRDVEVGEFNVGESQRRWRQGQ